MLVTVRSLLVLQCTMLFIQQGLSIKQFRTIEEFIQYYFHTRHGVQPEEDTPVGPTTEFSLEGTDEVFTTTEWMTTSLATPTVHRTPHPLMNRCCDLGRYIADNVPGRCHLIDEIDFISKNRNRPWEYNGRPRDGSHASSSYVARQYHFAFETCASFHASELRNEFYRCCKERTLPPVETTLIIPLGPRRWPSKHGANKKKRT